MCGLYGDDDLPTILGIETFHKSNSLRFKSTKNGNNFPMTESKIMIHIYFHTLEVKWTQGGKLVKKSIEEYKIVLILSHHKRNSMKDRDLKQHNTY
jgi:hypothetical protein